VKVGNMWGLPVNLIAFSLVAGFTTIAAFKVYGEVLLHPEQISAKFDSWCSRCSRLTFAVATLGINVVANFVSPAFDFANVFPRTISFKTGGYIAAGIALVLYPFAPWEGKRGDVVGAIGATMGPLLGICKLAWHGRRGATRRTVAAFGDVEFRAYSQER
jgi:NCS1 family nucleobase:cation symporter-1